MKHLLKKVKSFLFNTSAIVTTGALIVLPKIAYAADGDSGTLASSSLVTGLNRLINDASSVLMAAAIPVATIAAAFFLIRRSIADQQDQKQWTDRAKAAIICGIGALVVGGLIKVLASYFQ